jgi:hypothetical protein
MATRFFLGMIRRAIRVVIVLAIIDLGTALVNLFSARDNPFQHLPTGIPLLAVMAYAVTQLLEVARDSYFDFEAAFGEHLLHEELSAHVGRYIRGGLCVLLAGAMALVAAGPATLVWLLIRVPAGAAAIVLFTTGLRLLAPRGESVLRWSYLRPIVYLRSFSADAGLTEREDFDLLSFLFLGARKVETYERSLAAAVRDIGPLVAIGRPREKLPPLGAARMYVRDDWQRVVEELVAASRLVILRAGTTEGFLWELNHVVQHCDPQKIVILLPRDFRTKRYYRFWEYRDFHSERYARFRELASPVLPQGVPWSPDQALFIGFGRDWSPRLLGRRGVSVIARVRWLTGGTYAPALRAALGEKLLSLGLGSGRCPLQLREWLIVLYLIWVGKQFF